VFSRLLQQFIAEQLISDSAAKKFMAKKSRQKKVVTFDVVARRVESIFVYS
jgi:hypothetical protein